MHLRFVVLALAVALTAAGCTVAFKLTETGFSLEWPKAPSLPLPLPPL